MHAYKYKIEVTTLQREHNHGVESCSQIGFGETSAAGNKGKRSRKASANSERLAGDKTCEVKPEKDSNICNLLHGP